MTHDPHHDYSPLKDRVADLVTRLRAEGRHDDVNVIADYLWHLLDLASASDQAVESILWDIRPSIGDDNDPRVGYPCRECGQQFAWKLTEPLCGWCATGKPGTDEEVLRELAEGAPS